MGHESLKAAAKPVFGAVFWFNYFKNGLLKTE